MEYTEIIMNLDKEDKIDPEGKYDDKESKECVVAFANGYYGIRRNNPCAIREVEFLDLISANNGMEYWWTLTNNYISDCLSLDLLLVRRIFLEKPHIILVNEQNDFAAGDDIGRHIFDLDVAAAAYKLSGK
jgi:hypothetical protein